MMFSKRSAMAFLAAILCVSAAAAQQQPQRHGVLANKDLTDLLDGEVDEPFLQKAPRHLQEEMTAAPSSAPTPAPSTADGERGFEITFAPTLAPSMMTEAPVTSGASSWGPSASVASALVFVGSVAAAAVIA